MTIQEFNKTKIGVKRPPFSKEWKENLSKAHIGQKWSKERKEKSKGRIPWNKGKTGIYSKETLKKIGNATRGKKQTPEVIANRTKYVTGSNNVNWKGGITSENERIRKSWAYRDWRRNIFSRDNFTCKKCNQHGGILRAHHINNFADFPELRTIVENGITMCNECHINFHNKYGCKNNTLEQLLEFLK